MSLFRALRLHVSKSGVTPVWESLSLKDLSPGNVVIKAQYSCINYKDALAVTGKGNVLRTSPLVGGIDVAGTVVTSEDSRLSAGQEVVVVGAGLGETRDGGYSAYVRAPADAVVPVPPGLTLRDTMALGTAGFTAARAVMALEERGQSPERGPLVVTGATGGVGSFAVSMLAARGYEVVALTSKPSSAEYLKSLGAARMIGLGVVPEALRPLDKAQWAGAVDNVGGKVLAWLLSTTSMRGNVASIGLAESAQLETTVLPFILRGVSLLGINSVELTLEERIQTWHRLGTDLRPALLQAVAQREVALTDALGCFSELLNGTHVGRTILRIDL